jgi:hypothetical protein
MPGMPHGTAPMTAPPMPPGMGVRQASAPPK